MKVIKELNINFRDLSQQDLHLHCNVALATLLKSIYGSPKLDNSASMIVSLIHRSLKKNYIPPLIRKVSEIVLTSKGKSATINVLSAFNVVSSEKTSRKMLRIAPSYKQDFNNDKPVVSCVDNIDIKVYTYKKSLLLHRICLGFSLN